MQELKELAYIINKSKVQSIEIIEDEAKQHNSKLYQLYEAVQDQSVNTNIDAAKLVYGEAKISSKYRNLKHELKKRMLNTIFFIHKNNKKSREEQYYQCWKDWAACKILIEKSARLTAITLAEKILKKALDNNFYDLIISISILLRSHYALTEKNKEKFKYYDELYDHSKRQEKYKNLAHKYYMLLVLDHTSNGVTFNSKIKEDADNYCQELEKYESDNDGNKFYYYLYQIKLMGFMGIFDYSNAKEICNEAIHFLEGKYFQGGLRNFLLNKLVCNIQLKEFEEGRNTAKLCQKLVATDSFNWFKTQEYLMMLAFHTGEYQEAYKIYYSITNNARYKSHPVLHETWPLYKLYLHFLLLVGKVALKPSDKYFSILKLEKTINKIPKFAKDKQGMNIPILIIQMAILIQQGDQDKAIDRIESLDKYCERYLKLSNPNYRSYCFIKMLTQIPKANFNPIATTRKAEKYIQNLRKVDISFANQAHELEIIPFEELWKMLLKSL